MDAELKAKWVTALRSGEYRQGAGQLRFEDTFCCLGVLCDIIDPERWGASHKWDGLAALLPDQAARLHLGMFANMPNVDGSFYDTDGALTSLATLNDTGSTFAEIADIIEEKF